MKTAGDVAGQGSITMTVMLLMLQLWDRTGVMATNASTITNTTNSINSINSINYLNSTNFLNSTNCINSTNLTNSTIPPVVMCEDVRLNCAYGSGCSVAMHNYFSLCDRMLHDNLTTCPDQCLHSLVTLTSTEEGKRLLDCTCRDTYCEQMKARLEVCREVVIEAAQEGAVVPCDVAKWICSVDRVCTAAMGYYQNYCRRMQEGLSCSERCVNSIEILRRQEKAKKLSRCRCEGASTFECLLHKAHMVRLCYNGVAAGGKADKKRRKHRPSFFDQDPDQAEVEMMLANPNYRPGIRYSGGAGHGSAGGGGGGKGGASSVARGPPPATVLCALAAAAAFLVTAAALRDSPQ